MGKREDAYYDESLDNEGAGNEFDADDAIEDIEVMDDGTPNQSATSDSYVLDQTEAPIVAPTPSMGSTTPLARSAEDEQFLIEIEKAQSGTRGVVAMILTLSVSGVVFVAVGAAWWSWEFALTVAAILLIHELGHFVTMKSFRYRNVNMFFIPFLGAAVTGQRFDVPAWKKATVALMGPLPSIFLATVIGIAGMMMDLDWLVYACIVSLFLNGFNLVPLLPFDGGHVMHAVLFCRHFYLDVAARTITVVIMIALAVMLG